MHNVCTLHCVLFVHFGADSYCLRHGSLCALSLLLYLYWCCLVCHRGHSALPLAIWGMLRSRISTILLVPREMIDSQSSSPIVVCQELCNWIKCGVWEKQRSSNHLRFATRHIEHAPCVVPTPRQIRMHALNKYSMAWIHMSVGGDRDGRANIHTHTLPFERDVRSDQSSRIFMRCALNQFGGGGGDVGFSFFLLFSVFCGIK